MTTPAPEQTGFVGWMIAFVLVGAVLYVADSKIGAKLYRAWYNATSKKPLSKDVNVGFIYNRSANTRFSFAVMLSCLHAVIAVWHWHVNPISQVIELVFEVPSLMVGFYFLGPVFARVWERKDPLLDVVDDLHTGKTTLTDVLQHGGEAVRSAFGRTGEPDVVVPPEKSDVATPPVGSASGPALRVVKPEHHEPTIAEAEAMQDQFVHPQVPASEKKGGGHGGNNAA